MKKIINLLIVSVLLLSVAQTTFASYITSSNPTGYIGAGSVRKIKASAKAYTNSSAAITITVKLRKLGSDGMTMYVKDSDTKTCYSASSCYEDASYTRSAGYWDTWGQASNYSWSGFDLSSLVYLSN